MSRKPIIEENQIITQGSYWSKEEQDRLEIESAWRNFQFTKNPHYLADAILRVDFFGQPEAARAIAALLRGTTTRPAESVKPDIADSTAVRWGKLMAEDDKIRLLALDSVNEMLLSSGRDAIAAPDFTTKQLFRWAALLLSGAVSVESFEDEAGAVKALVERSKRRRDRAKKR